MPLPVNDPIIAAIRERLRAIVGRVPHRSLTDLASRLAVEPEQLRVLLDESDRRIDVAFLIDVVAAFVREFAVDPQWLLTGRYDATQHRRALGLGEDPSAEGRYALREFVQEQYRRLRDGLSFFLPLDGDAVPTFEFLETRQNAELGALVQLAKPVAR